MGMGKPSPGSLLFGTINNPFQANAPFLYPRETSENQTFSGGHINDTFT